MLTELQIEKLSLPEKRREIPDGKVAGLYLIHQPSGARSWALRYRIGGAPKKFTIGVWPEIRLGAARKRAQKALAEVADGNDPSAKKKAAREAQKAAAAADDRVEKIIEDFIEKYLAKEAKPSWAKEAARLLRVEIVPKFGKKRLGEITDDNVGDLLTAIDKRGAPITANRTFAVFRKLCNWAMTKAGGKLITASPCVGLAAPGKEHSRDRVLDDKEIRLAWEAFDAIGWPFGSIGKLLLLTGARRDEVASMKWAEIDLAAKTWTLPRARKKNNQPHEIPLSDDAADIISALPHIGEKRGGLVFTVTGNSAVSGFSRAKAAIDKAVLDRMKEDAEARGDDPDEVEAIEPWVMHDLRRTLATNLQKMGVKLEVTEAILGHSSGTRKGIIGVYQRYEYGPEKRAALEAWARKLDAIVTGAPTSNVVELAVGRAK
jgi:integrase